MAYSITIVTLPFGTFFPPAPTSVIGRFSAANGTMIETVMGSTASGGKLTVNFVSAATPPTGQATLLVSDISGPGDVFRSGVMTAWPPSPATLMVLPIPPVTTPGMSVPPPTGSPLTKFNTAQIAALVAPLAGRPVPIPLWIIGMSTTLTGGTFIPTAMTIGGVTIKTAAPNLITATITGTLFFTKFFFFAVSSGFTAEVTLAVTPSGDAVNTARVFAFSVAGSSFNPGFISPGISLTLWMFAPLFVKILESEIDKALNGAIMAMVDSAVAKFSPAALGSSAASSAVTLSPTASICAQKVSVAPGGITVQMLVSDLFGPLIVLPKPPPPPPPPKPKRKMLVSITPKPVANVSKAYVVKVLDQATGAVIVGASVDIRTGRASGTGAWIVVSGKTGMSGETLPLTVTLRFRQVRVGAGRDADVDMVSPTLTVSMETFDTEALDLLESP